MYNKKEVRTMDSFLKEIDTELLKRWLLNQNEDDWDAKEVNDNIVIETKYGLGSINFYPNCIIELDVENKMTKEKSSLFISNE